MEITKFRHACFVSSKNGQSIVVDPGELSEDFLVPDGIVAVVVTHVHGDHWSSKHLQKMPNVPIFAPDDAADAIRDTGFEVETVHVGDKKTAGEFTLTFTGGEHAIVHPMQSMCHNVGVDIDHGEIYYPGDSFATPPGPVKILAVPLGAPWMKLAEAMDFLMTVRPEKAFPTHDGVLSDAGKMFHDNWMKQAAEKVGTVYERLEA